jgi:1,2-dihydroxy-3-keto-5-methylthiopentene dioxygenase
MTLLASFAEDGRKLSQTNSHAEIAARLEQSGIRYERWSASAELPADACQDDIIEVYRDDVERLKGEGGYRLVDVVRMRPDDEDAAWPAKAAEARKKFLSEHVHGEDEVRFFVEGRGCFYLHLGQVIHAVVCEAGDLLGVPAGTPHWYDMGASPEFCAIRFFQEEDGWIAEFTGSAVAQRIPSLDDLLADSR